MGEGSKQCIKKEQHQHDMRVIRLSNAETGAERAVGTMRSAVRQHLGATPMLPALDTLRSDSASPPCKTPLFLRLP